MGEKIKSVLPNFFEKNIYGVFESIFIFCELQKIFSIIDLIKLFTMYQNEVSKKTKKQNNIRIKTKSFQTNYTESFNRVANKSSSHNLAGNLYSTKTNNQMSPKKMVMKSTSLSQIVFQNPEKFFNNQGMKGLNTRASHISNYSDINTELILSRKSLQQKISYLKDAIARQNRLNSKAQINCKKNQYDLQKSNNGIKQLTIKSSRLNDGIVEAKHDCLELRKNINDLRAQNEQTHRVQGIQNENIARLQEICKNLKNNLLNEDRNRGILKERLISMQVQMNKKSIYLKQDEQEKAHVLLAINNFCLQNKLD